MIYSFKIDNVYRIMKGVVTVMIKHFLLFVTMCLFFNLCACSPEGKSESENTVFFVADYPLQVTCPYSWWQKEESNFDLQCKSNDSAIIMSVFSYYDIDLSVDMSRQEFFEYQNQLLLDMRENISLIEEMTETQYEDKSITSILYSAENENIKNYYYMNLVSINNSDCFAWVLFTGMPSEINAERDTIDDILKTVKLTVG